MRRFPGRVIWDYLLEKFSASGFIWFVFSMAMLIGAEGDLYDFADSVSHGMLWAAFFGYAILSSMIIDFLYAKLPFSAPKIKMLLYIAAGYLIFMLSGDLIFALIAGSVGAVFSLLFYAATRFLKKDALKYVFAIAVPLTVLAMSQMDFTEKEGWESRRTSSSYTATFEYFNGRHEIPIRLLKGETVLFSVDVKSENGGGYGYHVETGTGELKGVSRLSDEKMSFVAEEAGKYRIVMEGHSLEGMIFIDWRLK
ncbi:hypothetical protein [Bacillus marinisedimentorum]|uniref:hypothetical protein n=1 Tax=Bacillus marinisedimentorum TaxID=1821260 RepID=UPI0012FF72C8|nr:hypothetical protein [Bacillus marinisedimentorum]